MPKSIRVSAALHQKIPNLDASCPWRRDSYQCPTTVTESGTRLAEAASRADLIPVAQRLDGPWLDYRSIPQLASKEARVYLRQDIPCSVGPLTTAAAPPHTLSAA